LNNRKLIYGVRAIHRDILIFLSLFPQWIFVAAEFAIVKVRLTQIELLAIKGNWQARLPAIYFSTQ